MDARRGVARGMTVYTRDGEKLGKVVAVDDGGLFVEKGFFFPREYGFRFDDVEDLGEGSVHLRLDREAVAAAAVEDGQGPERNRPSVVARDVERDTAADRETRSGGPGDARQLGTEANPPAGSRASSGLQWSMEPLETVARGTSERRDPGGEPAAEDPRSIDARERSGAASGRVPVDPGGMGLAHDQVPDRDLQRPAAGASGGAEADPYTGVTDTGEELRSGVDRDVDRPSTRRVEAVSIPVVATPGAGGEARLATDDTELVTEQQGDGSREEEARRVVQPDREDHHVP